MPDEIHPNLEILRRLDIANLDACAELFADDFVWRYFNSTWPEVDGVYRGVSGLKQFFAKVNESSGGTFEVNPVDVRAVGDELVVAHARNRLATPQFNGNTIELDAVVIWRIVHGKIVEAWDIPAVHSSRPVQQATT